MNPFSSALSQFLESDALCVLLETLPAHVKSVFSDQSVRIGANSAFPRPRSVLSGVGVPNVVVTHAFWS